MKARQIGREIVKETFRKQKMRLSVNAFGDNLEPLL